MRTLAIWAMLMAPAAARARQDEPLLTAMEAMVQSAAAKGAPLTVGVWVDREPEAARRSAMRGPGFVDPYLKRPAKSPARRCCRRCATTRARTNSRAANCNSPGTYPMSPASNASR